MCVVETGLSVGSAVCWLVFIICWYLSNWSFNKLPKTCWAQLFCFCLTVHSEVLWKSRNLLSLFVVHAEIGLSVELILINSLKVHALLRVHLQLRGKVCVKSLLLVLCFSWQAVCDLVPGAALQAHLCQAQGNNAFFCTRVVWEGWRFYWVLFFCPVFLPHLLFSFLCSLLLKIGLNRTSTTWSCLTTLSVCLWWYSNVCMCMFVAKECRNAFSSYCVYVKQCVCMYAIKLRIF